MHNNHHHSLLYYVKLEPDQVSEREQIRMNNLFQGVNDARRVSQHQALALIKVAICVYPCSFPRSKSNFIHTIQKDTIAVESRIKSFCGTIGNIVHK